MKAVVADTSYFLALGNPNDAAHALASELSQTLHRPILTTVWVLTELGDALAFRKNRPKFLGLLEMIERDPTFNVVPPHQDLWEQGTDLYRNRLDKDWSLTDCISFVVMQEHRVTEALTGDKHFTQAGFKALLK